jgi:DNA recombination protein RmuC
MLKTTTELSNKLLEDHKRENEAAKKQTEEKIRQTNEKLLEQFDTITKSVASLKDQTHQTRERMATVWQALTSPASVGQLAEVGLENSLKNLGLEAERDFSMQYAISSEAHGKLRPDAIIFLPQNMVMVIDSKASKFLVELAEASEKNKQEVIEKLKKSMAEHVRALASKDYKTAVQAAFKEAGHSDKISQVFNIMYLPSESAIETIKQADSSFLTKVEKAGLILAGPSSLYGLLSIARYQIDAAKQAENQHVIVETVSELMDNLITALGYVNSVGKGIKSTAEHFDKFARSLNRRLLPKLHSLQAVGVTPSKHKELPSPIPTYDIRQSNEIITIDSEEEQKILPLTKQEEAS